MAKKDCAEIGFAKKSEPTAGWKQRRKQFGEVKEMDEIRKKRAVATSIGYRKDVIQIQ